MAKRKIKTIINIYVIMQTLTIMAGSIQKNALGSFLDDMEGVDFDNIFTQHLSSEYNNQQQNSKPTIHTDEYKTLPNGCYKEVIREPDSNDHRRYIETEQLVCPPSWPQQQHQQTPNAVANSNPFFHNYGAFSQMYPATSQSRGDNQISSMKYTTPSPFFTFATTKPNNLQDNLKSQNMPHVFVLSKKIGLYKKNSAIKQSGCFVSFLPLLVLMMYI
uniref:Uncharacterized protein n=1 Tax=Stomoxys calcitrans TaxID=35570 RepID=A0A1I8NWM2_STOCA